MAKHIPLSRRACWAGGEPIASILMARALANPQVVSLAAGFVDQESLPVELVRASWEAVWSDRVLARAALQYGTTVGYGPLREMILDRMRRADAQCGADVRLSIDQVVITAGSNQLLYLAADALLDPGDIVLCGAPSYFVFLGTLANLGAAAYGVATDDAGLIPAAVDEQLAALEREGQLGRVKLVYVTTYFDNPTGVTLSAARRAELVEVVRRWSQKSKLYLIEDTAYRELRYYGPDVPSLRSFDAEGDTVAVAGSFSKSFSPGMRVGWGILPRGLLQPVLAQKGNLDFGSPNLNQVLMADVLGKGRFDPHLERLRESYRQKIDAVLSAADEFLGPLGGIHWVRPGGGLYLWVRLPEGMDTGVSGPLFDLAAKEGVLYVPGAYCFPGRGRPTPRHILRLSFAMPSCQDIRRGMEALGRALRQVL